MEKTILSANPREVSTKASKNELRKKGLVPGIFYMKGQDTIHLSVKDKELNSLVFTPDTHLISLQIEGSEELECVIKDVQFDPITDKVVHFDLLGLTRGEKFQLEVPIQLHGSPIGVKEGGIIQHTLHKLEIECLPTDIPQRIDVEIGHLKLGDALYVSDLKLENIEIITPEDNMIVAITHPKVEKEPEEGTELAEGEEKAEPEVIGKGKSEDGEDEKVKGKEKPKDKEK